MQSAQEFMDSYLRELAELGKSVGKLNQNLEEKFFTKELLGIFSELRAERDKNPESFSSLEEDGEGSARIITTQLISGKQLRQRYHLRRSAENWAIFKKEFECFLCHGTGRKAEKPCRHCNEVGWKDYLQPKN